MDQTRWNPCVTANVLWITTLIAAVAFVVYSAWKSKNALRFDLPPPPVPPTHRRRRSD